MAATPEIKMSIEKVVHNVLEQVGQDVWNKYRICIKDVFFEWVDISTPSNIDMRIRKIEVKTQTRYL